MLKDWRSLNDVVHEHLVTLIKIHALDNIVDGVFRSRLIVPGIRCTTLCVDLIRSGCIMLETTLSISRIRKIGRMDGCHIERSKE